MLQQYLTSELRHLAEREQVSDVLDAIQNGDGGRVGLRQAAQDLDDERAPVIVIDASVLANALGDDEEDGHSARRAAGCR